MFSLVNCIVSLHLGWHKHFLTDKQSVFLFTHFKVSVNTETAYHKRSSNVLNDGRIAQVPCRYF